MTSLQAVGILRAGVFTDHDPVSPTGWILLKDGNRKLAKLKLGTFMKEIDVDLAVGMHLITAIYEGDNYCFGSQSAAFKLRVKPARKQSPSSES